MRANELVIGDWVQIVEPCKYAGAIGRIKTLIDHKDEENAYFKVFLRNNTIHIGIEDICSEDIRPINLTKEILEKNGFIRYGTSYFLKESMFELSNPSNPDRYLDNYYIRLARQNKRVMYVHKLQHFMKEFGIEKEIEL